MNILVSITSYHKDKEKYVYQILRSYEYIAVQLGCKIDIIISSYYEHSYVTTNNLILNKSDYVGEFHCWSNTKYIMENFKNYDYIIESDDDILISLNNIKQYMKCESMDLCYIPGFIVTEDHNVNKKTYIHSMLFNKPPHITDKVVLNDQIWFIPHTKHAACYMIDRVRLETYLDKNQMAVIPKGIDVLDIQCTARSEIYYYFKKMINLNELDNHLVKHLPNKYLHSNIFPVDQYRTVEFWKDHINII
jgi:hypothetical protein